MAWLFFISRWWLGPISWIWQLGSTTFTLIFSLLTDLKKWKPWILCPNMGKDCPTCKFIFNLRVMITWDASNFCNLYQSSAHKSLCEAGCSLTNWDELSDRRVCRQLIFCRERWKMTLRESVLDVMNKTLLWLHIICAVNANKITLRESNERLPHSSS